MFHVVIFDAFFIFTVEIGWRPQSDKIIVVASDEEFHYGGDGRVSCLESNYDNCLMKFSRLVELSYQTMESVMWRMVVMLALLFM